MKRLLIFAGSALVLVWLLFPAADIVAPDWNVVVTDTDGHPIAGASVTVFSQQYTIERVDHEETQITGADGRVHFGERRIRAMNLIRVLGALRNLHQGVHASFGVHTHLNASMKGYGDPSALNLFGQNERESRADGKARQSSHIILMRCPPGYSGIGCAFPDDPNRPVLPLEHSAARQSRRRRSELAGRITAYAEVIPKCIPQGLKPGGFWGYFWPADAMPFQNTLERGNNRELGSLRNATAGSSTSLRSDQVGEGRQGEVRGIPP